MLLVKLRSLGFATVRISDPRWDQQRENCLQDVSALEFWRPFVEWQKYPRKNGQQRTYAVFGKVPKSCWGSEFPGKERLQAALEFVDSHLGIPSMVSVHIPQSDVPHSATLELVDWQLSEFVAGLASRGVVFAVLASPHWTRGHLDLSSGPPSPVTILGFPQDGGRGKTRTLEDFKAMLRPLRLLSRSGHGASPTEGPFSSFPWKIRSQKGGLLDFSEFVAFAALVRNRTAAMHRHCASFSGESIRARSGPLGGRRWVKVSLVEEEGFDRWCLVIGGEGQVVMGNWSARFFERCPDLPYSLRGYCVC
eukprot:RCo027896